LQSSEEKFAKIFRASPLITTLMSLETRVFIEVNEVFERTTGWTRAEAIGRTPDDLNLWADPSVKQEFLAALATGAVRNLEVHFRMKNGETRICLGSSEVIEIDGEQCILSMADDITEIRRQDERRLRHATIVESLEDAIISLTLEGGITSWNAGAQRMFGYTEEETIGRHISIILPPEKLHEEDAFLHEVREGRPVEHYETKRVAKDGRTIHVSVMISPARDAKGRIVGASKIARDIGHRKEAEAVLRESEERFRLVANTAPVMIWMSGVDKLCTFFNEVWLQFTGKRIEQEIGNGWAAGVHPDDFDRCFETYVQSFDKRIPFKMEYRILRHDGQFRWILDHGVPRFDAEGSFVGYIGSCMDISERKLAEEALSSVNRKLIEAHEEERASLARELHDDINQRLALLATDFDALTHGQPPMEELREHVRQAGLQIVDLSEDIQALSHRLHSSKLEYLGLAAAAASFCKEFSTRNKLEIDFRPVDVPRELAPEISLCVFRVLQEALQNAAKHSGTRRFRVALRGGSGEIHLAVQDSGVGFNPEEAQRGRGLGLGLVSMRERLKLVYGTLTIESRLYGGTTVHARVPLRPRAQKAGA
jgi:PAS domain S-box-containing protein